MSYRTHLILSALLFVLTFAVPAAASDEDSSDWVYDVKIYGWLPDAPAAMAAARTSSSALGPNSCANAAPPTSRTARGGVRMLDRGNAEKTFWNHDTRARYYRRSWIQRPAS